MKNLLLKTFLPLLILCQSAMSFAAHPMTVVDAQLPDGKYAISYYETGSSHEWEEDYHWPVMYLTIKGTTFTLLYVSDSDSVSKPQDVTVGSLSKVTQTIDGKTTHLTHGIGIQGKTGMVRQFAIGRRAYSFSEKATEVPAQKLWIQKVFRVYLSLNIGNGLRPFETSELVVARRVPNNEVNKQTSPLIWRQGWTYEKMMSEKK